MRKLIFLAFAAFCSPFVVNCNKDFDYRVVRVEKMNETDELFKYTLDVEKVDKTTLKVNSESDLFIDLDNEWHMWIQVFHNAEGKEEFGEKPMLNVPKRTICEFMQTTYKDRIYPLIKDCSNFPAPDDCPIVANHFVMKDLVVNMEKYSSLALPGMWKVSMFLSQDHEESHVTKMGMNILTLVEEKKEA